jgi:hypothetical protein
VEVGASWTAAVAAMAAAAEVEETEEGKHDREFLPSKGKRAMARNKEASSNGNTRECYKTKHSTEETRKKKKKKKKRRGGAGVRDGQRFLIFLGGPFKSVFLPPKKKTSKLRCKILPNFPRKITVQYIHPYIHVFIHVCKLNLFILLHGCFFWVDVVNIFFPEFFCHFWDKHIGKVFGKKFN